MLVKIDGVENKEFSRNKNLFLSFLKDNTHSGKLSPQVEVFKSIDVQKDSFHWVMSTFDVDRDFEKVDPSGWNLKNYLANPVILWSHDYSIPAIGYAENVKADTALEGDIVFNSKEFDEFGWSIGERVKAGALRCGSVGFIAEEVEFLEAKDRECDLIFRKQELLEFSICCVPANPFARNGEKKLEITEVIQEPEELSYWDKLTKGLHGLRSAYKNRAADNWNLLTALLSKLPKEENLNEVIVSLQQKLENMKTLVPTEAATPEQISKYFNENEEIIAGILKAADSQTTATTSELEGIKEAVKELRNLMRKADTEMKPLSYRDVCYNLGKALCAAWNKDAETLGQLKFCPNIRAEKWNNPKDFSWETGKGFVPSKAVLGEPIGNLANNDQYLINPIYEETIMQEAAKQSQMMNLVTHRPMSGPSIFIPERDRGGIELKWLTSYGQKIDATKSNMPTRTELKAYTLAGYVPFFDEFGEDVFVDLGKMFVEDFTEAYGQ